MTYHLEKKIWSDADFDNMGWHDNRIHKIRLTKDLELDIDYILQWNHPELEGLPFTFWIAPATLIFKNVKYISFELDTGLEGCFDIEEIDRENQTQWTISTRQGYIRLTSNGFEQFIRQEPSFQFGQTISYIERFGYSLDRITNQENPNAAREDILEQRKQDLEHYENVKKRHIRKRELEYLNNSSDRNEIDTKFYLLKKKEINQLLLSYNLSLKGTRFENW